MTVWIASFDIGKINFAFYIEEFDIDYLQSLPKFDKQNKYNENGTLTLDYENSVVNKVYQSGKLILLKNYNITQNCKKGSYLEPEMFHNMYDLLESYEEYWNHCDAFIIEKQMSFGRQKINTMALKLGQHCWSYFSFVYGREKNIVEFPAYHKTLILGAEQTLIKTKRGKYKYKTMDKPTRKKWTEKVAGDILILHSDENDLKVYKEKGKKDDKADTICQLQAYKILVYIDNLIV